MAVEADWPDAYRVNRFVRGRSDDVTAQEALRGFQRFPTWMWRNTDVLDFVGWLPERNCRLGDERLMAGFTGWPCTTCAGLPRRSSPTWSGPIPKPPYVPRKRYSCFDHASGDDGESYGFAAVFGAGATCELEVVAQLVETQRRAAEYAKRDGLLAEDEPSTRSKTRSS